MSNRAANRAAARHGPTVTHAEIRAATGSRDDALALYLVSQLANVLWASCEVAPHQREQVLQAALATLHGIAPRDETEGMLAAQMVAAHHAAMAHFQQAAPLPIESPLRDRWVHKAAGLMEAFARHANALEERRLSRERAPAVSGARRAPVHRDVRPTNGVCFGLANQEPESPTNEAADE